MLIFYAEGGKKKQESVLKAEENIPELKSAWIWWIKYQLQGFFLKSYLFYLFFEIIVFVYTELPQCSI